MNNKKKFSRKLLVSMFITGLIPIFIFIVLTYSLIQKNILKEGIDVKYQDYVNQINRISSDYENKAVIIDSISRDYSLLKNWVHDISNYEIVDKYLKDQKDLAANFISIYMTMKNGDQFNSEFKVPEVDTRRRYWYMKAIDHGEIVWTDPYADIFTKEQVITIATPIKDDKGIAVGVLGADLEFEKTLRNLEQIKISEDATTYLFNEYWYPIGDGQNRRELSELYKLLKDEFEDDSSGYKIMDIDEKSIVAISELGFNGWKIVSIVKYKNLIEELLPLTLSYGLLIVLVIGLIAIVATRLSKMIIRPLEKLEYMTKQVSSGNYDEKVIIDTGDEFESLAKTFHNMMDEINESQNSLESKNQELKDMNDQLQDFNIELEASLEQLMATTSLLENSEEKYKTLMDNMYDIVFIVDKDGNINFVNRAFLNLFSKRISDTIGKNVLEFFEEARFCGEIKLDEMIELSKMRDLENLELFIENDLSKKIYFEANIKRIIQKGEYGGAQIVLKDVTERREAEHYLHKRNRDLMVINRVAGRINSTLDESVLYEKLASDLMNMLEIKSCSIRIFNENELQLKAFNSEIEGWDLKDKLKPKHPVFMRVVEEGDVVTIKYSEKPEYFNLFSDHNQGIFEKNDIKEIVCIPLKDRKKINGMITITGKQDLEDIAGNVIVALSEQLSTMIDNIRLYRIQKDQYLNTIKALVAAEEAKDKYTEGHSMRVAAFSEKIAQKMNLSESEVEEIKAAAILHDIGKIGISDIILNKTGTLTDYEYEEIKKHPEMGHKILKFVDFSQTVLNGVLYHHKRFDLMGYPSHEIDKLPIEASIIGVADAFDAMTSSRSYRKAMSVEEAVLEIGKHKSTQFDKNVVDIFLDIVENERGKIKEIMEEI